MTAILVSAAVLVFAGGWVCGLIQAATYETRRGRFVDDLNRRYRRSGS
jgi:uncharacterized membrane protein YGL010W